MNTLSWLAAGAAVGIAMPFVTVLLQRRRDAVSVGVGAVTAGARRERIRPANPFAGVSVEHAPDCSCEAVRQLGQRRFLAVRAPALPLPGCDRARCDCRYVRHADRRTSDDRRDLYSTFDGHGHSPDGERRTAGRRRRRG